MKHIPRKYLGQIFLSNKIISNNIVKAISPNKTDIMVEIGPGLAAITNLLYKLLTELHVIELDQNLVKHLQNQFNLKYLHIYECNALKFDFTSIKLHDHKKLRIVGNLPYYIATELLFKLAEITSYIQDQHFMLQKELVERIIAKPGNKNFCKLSVMLQWRYQIDCLFFVLPENFYPRPKVTSAFIRMIPLKNPLICEQKILKKIVNQAFSKKRKMLKNSMDGLINEHDLIQNNINPKLRPEDITIKQYVKLANFLKMHPINADCRT